MFESLNVEQLIYLNVNFAGGGRGGGFRGGRGGGFGGGRGGGRGGGFRGGRGGRGGGRGRGRGETQSFQLAAELNDNTFAKVNCSRFVKSL